MTPYQPYNFDSKSDRKDLMPSMDRRDSNIIQYTGDIKDYNVIMIPYPSQPQIIG